MESVLQMENTLRMSTSCLEKPKQNSWMHSLNRTHKPANKILTADNESALTGFQSPRVTEFPKESNHCYSLEDKRYKKESSVARNTPLRKLPLGEISPGKDKAHTRPRTATTTRRHVQPKVARNTHCWSPIRAKSSSPIRSGNSLNPIQYFIKTNYNCGERTSCLDNSREMNGVSTLTLTVDNKSQLEKKTKKMEARGTEILLDKQPVTRLLCREREPSFVLTPPGFDVRYLTNDEIRPVAKEFSELTEEQKRSVTKCKHWISKYGMYMAGGERFHLARQT